MSGRPPRLARRAVLAHRVLAQQLDRVAARPAELAVLRLGLQEAMGNPILPALVARCPDPAPPPVGPGEDLALVWSLRGAPHVHRRADLDALAAALLPRSEADAALRLGETGPSVRRAGIGALEQFAAAVRAVRAVVTAPIAKGAASTAVTAALPAAMGRDCRGCGTRHVSDPALRAACLVAGVELEPGTTPPVLVPRAGAVVPDAADPAALRALVRAAVDLLGPASPADVADLLGVRRADLLEAWPGEHLVPVEVDGRPAALPEADLEAVRAAPEPDLVRLLGPFDPWLQARDRDVIVPDRALQKALWPVLGRPGAVLVDGEVIGTWRARTTGRATTLTVDPAVPLPPSRRDELEAEAALVSASRGTSRLRLVGV